MSYWAPAPQKGTAHSHVVQVANGRYHALMLTDEGIVYSWGTKSSGALGRSGKEKEPSPVTFDNDRAVVIVQIACGWNHSLALSQTGILYAWGRNKAGQLGVDGFRHDNSEADKTVHKPTVVKGFHGKERIVKSCSCGPESSACITARGDVFVWGALSYFLCGGTQGPGGLPENCTVPVQVRGISEACRAEHGANYAPSSVALYKDQLVCTVEQVELKDELADRLKSLKSRDSLLRNLKKQMKPDADDGDDELGGELGKMDRNLKEAKANKDSEILRIKEQRAAFKAELQSIARELTICDQQNTALSDRADLLERDCADSQAAGPADKRGPNRALETELHDVNHFKSSNKRTKMQFFERRDRLERDYAKLTEALVAAEQEREYIETRAKLIRALARGDLGGGRDHAADDEVRIAVNKQLELAATEPQTLARVGRFTGLREVLAISDRALVDASSALKEVSAASPHGDSTLEAILEASLKLRKEANAKIQEKLAIAEQGRKGWGGGQRDIKGMVDFFSEISQNPSRIEDTGSTRRLALGGLFG